MTTKNDKTSNSNVVNSPDSNVIKHSDTGSSHVSGKQGKKHYSNDGKITTTSTIPPKKD